MNQKYLFLFTLTPVQSFISQARKTQDLWAGSSMLSALMSNVYASICEKGGKVIFPHQIAESMPNRILASFDFSKSNEELKQLGQEIASAVTQALNELIGKAQNELDKEYGIIKESFEKQLKDFFSTFWVFVEIENNDYANAYEKADRLLGAVKNARTFTQNPEQGRKCSLSGEQNALVFNKAPLPSYATKVVQIETDMIDDKEGLSAISFIKRFYPFDKNRKRPFDSTADIALLKNYNEANEAFQAYENIFNVSKFIEQEKCLNLDGTSWTKFNAQFFYEENLTSKQIPCKQQLEVVKKQYSQLRSTLKEKDQKLIKYYAILLFDADSMGAWLSGEYLADKQQLEAFHKHLSSLLSTFAQYAKNYVDGVGEYALKKGRTVYAGGDDYLGFINLPYLFDVMKTLRENFKQQVSNRITNHGEFTFIGKDEMTFSAGISIAHYKTPLSEVLAWARKMEKEAKDTDYKDSFGMAVLKKSGEIRKAVLPFKNTNGFYLSENIQGIVNFLNEEKYSPKFIKVLEKELSLFDKDFAYRGRIVKSESKRLIENSRNKQKIEKVENENLIALVEEIYNCTELQTNYKDNHFHATLSICDFITRKLQGND